MEEEKSGSLNTNVELQRWPNLGDKLFRPGDGWRENASKLAFSSGKLEVYAIGYKDAADALVDRLLETGQSPDLQFFPIAFLYRHYLELRLKELLVSGGQLLDRDASLQHGHNLNWLWKKVRTILEDVWPGSTTVELNALESCINEFCELDANSESFRYPVRKDGTLTLAGLEHVSIVNLKEIMNRLGSMLDCSSMGIDDYLRSKPDSYSWEY